MTAPATRGRRAPGRGLKSPLAVPGAPTAASPGTFGPLGLPPERAALSDREAKPSRSLTGGAGACPVLSPYTLAEGGVTVHAGML
jgi:hypothetical protein